MSTDGFSHPEAIGAAYELGVKEDDAFTAIGGSLVLAAVAANISFGSDTNVDDESTSE